MRFTTGYGANRPPRKFLKQILAALLLWPVAAAADPVRIVALGDSLVAGYGLDAGDGFVPRMQAWLTAHDVAAELVNAGLSGDTTSGGRERLDWALTPDTGALIVSLGGNDILRAIDPALARENLHAILATARARALPVLLIGINVPPNFGPDYQAEFAAIYPELAAEFGTLYYPDFLHVFIDKGDRTATLAAYFQGDGLHPNATGVELIVDDMGPVVAELAAQAGAG